MELWGAKLTSLARRFDICGKKMRLYEGIRKQYGPQECHTGAPRDPAQAVAETVEETLELSKEVRELTRHIKMYELLLCAEQEDKKTVEQGQQ